LNIAFFEWLLFGGGLLLGIAGFAVYRFFAKESSERRLEEQNKVIAIKNKEISDSLDYAHKIQTAILPLTSDLARVFPSGLGIYMPKDIVSGDFYWFAELENYFFVAVGDCTGHGVPGAFMSLLGTDKLTHAVREQKISDPGKILEYLNKSIKGTLRQTAADGLRDGMDIGLCRFDFNKKIMTFAGANRPLYQLRNTVLTEFKPTKAAIGGFTTGEQVYTEVQVPFIEEDSFFLFTDGFPDQFGGPAVNAGGKKFTTRRFKDLLVRISEQHMAEQDKALHRELDAWMNYDGIKYDQTDDILVIGLRV
jgi:serine phosphatase RsbU (regulator of sigma subunit)